MLNTVKNSFTQIYTKLKQLLKFISKNESPRPWQWAFQTPSSIQMEGLYDLYLDVMMVLVAVGVVVAYLFVVAIGSWNNDAISWIKDRKLKVHAYKPEVAIIQDQMVAQLTKFRPSVFFSHHAVVEFIWTLIPCILLLLIAIPSFTLVLAMDEDFRPWLWVKVIGNQWYWTYECSTYSTKLKAVQYDSVMVATADLKNKYLRLLVTDTNLTIPFKRPTRFLVASNDVIHSWAVPSLGVKIDACPGRINSVTVIPTRLGVFYGQCSEICGVNHAFMPIVVQVVA